MLSEHVLAILWFLLPGFVAMWVFAGLTAYPKLSEFERVVEALIFTAFAQAATVLVRLWLLHLGSQGRVWGEWTPGVERVWSIALAVMLGLLFATLANYDAVHKVLRRLKLTKQTGYPSEWFGAFTDRGRNYVTLYLEGERRLFGSVDEWPTDPKSGHFSMAEAEWLDDDKRIALNGVRILIPATQVIFVEFMPIQSKGEEHESETAAATPTTSATEGTSAIRPD